MNLKENNDVEPCLPNVPHNKLDLLRVKLNSFKPYYPELTSKFRLDFCLAHNVARRSQNNAELCAAAGKMIYTVLSDLHTTVESALENITGGEEYLRLWQNYNNVPRPPRMERPSIYVYFGSDKICLCCILVLFKKFTDEDSYKNFMMSCIHELKEKAGCDPDDDDFDILFDYRKANAVRIMFGAHFVLRSNAIKNLVNWMYHVDTRLGAVCQYLCNMFSWYEMEHFNLLNDMLVNPQSPVLLDPRILREVDNLTDACSAVMDCEYPQFYSLMVTNADSLKGSLQIFLP
jgi:hypothetical protein